MATNNKEARVKIGEQRFLRDAASGSLGGSTVIEIKPIDALLEVKITPRISGDNSINLQVLVTINEFIAAANTGNNTQTTRNLETNANIHNGGIFALGGLIKNTTANIVTETPFLSKIPILGWFLKKRRNEVIQNNLTVFICPTIIEPRLRGGVNEYTAEYITLAKDYAQENLFGTLKDPITHWFFKPYEDTDEVINTYIDRTQRNALPSDTNEDIEPINYDSSLATLHEKLQAEPNPFLNT
jgi:type II secretory pathway component GspD/PulD (secretin)